MYTYTYTYRYIYIYIIVYCIHVWSSPEKGNQMEHKSVLGLWTGESSTKWIKASRGKKMLKTPWAGLKNSNFIWGLDENHSIWPQSPGIYL